jgi:hypothetical protein
MIFQSKYILKIKFIMYYLIEHNELESIETFDISYSFFYFLFYSNNNNSQLLRQQSN